MKPLFALTLLIGTSLVPVLHSAGIIHRAGAQEQVAEMQTWPRSRLFEALENRASEEAARQLAGTAEVAHHHPGMAWDRERAFAGMERLRAGIVMLSGLHGAQRELLQWNRERIKTGLAPAVLPPSLCREMPLGAWCPLLPATFGVASRAAAGSAAMSAAPAAENTPPTESGNGPLKDESQ